ncbi:hypothetical protein DL766_009694 [Monosporascus sp. MC13-8B]|uniref:EGF-like domain-containing protein n=1 Tax=Monosporascus cannonballus TaxID=155416 RepID=A0ABY0GTQ4_9PEZI|nr:hypothetical protein DL762_009419 [Monosporascus cannonballus]RYP14412.1 hypothetical protein DL766_009694 [Monosporascus sp. MC13-8B]
MPQRPVEDFDAGGPRFPRPQAPAGIQARDGQSAVPISRPTQVPQWPLAGPIPSPPAESEPYRPPPGRSQPPQRPPRPSHVPSILDGSRVQDPTLMFLSRQNPRGSELSAADTQRSSSSRPSTLSSVGSIPDFPLPADAPAGAPAGPPRRSVNLGPPPSSRRGDSSFYSTASFVSPIPEESPRTRSYASCASSAAIPESYGEISPAPSSNNGAFFDDTIPEGSVYSDDADESRLVRSASIGKRGKPSLVVTRNSDKLSPSPEAAPKSEQDGAFREGTAYVEGPSTSSDNSSRGTGRGAVTADTMLSAFQAASATDPSSARNATPSPKPFRLSALRRPPRLDIDAVRDAEARGSLTSLPDLIRRATRLASIMDKGRRPTSRFGELDFPEAIYGNHGDRNTCDGEKYQSGLSDMLAAFPPPATGSRQADRQSGNSWPLPFARRSYRGPDQSGNQPADGGKQKRERRCCGMPLWVAFMLLFILLCLIAAAIILPLYFLVINKPDDNGTALRSTEECGGQVTCANGGTIVVNQGQCSCICSFGFTGSDCTIPSAQGCTTTSIDTPDSTVSNVTMGRAVPRLLEDAQANFSIPLSAMTLLAKFNSGNLSCNTQNALITFGGQALQVEGAFFEIEDESPGVTLLQANGASISALLETDATLRVRDPAVTDSTSFIAGTYASTPTFDSSVSVILDTTLSPRGNYEVSQYPTAEVPSPTTTTSRSSTTTPQPTPTFTIDGRVLDFARVAVLYIFQEEALNDAATAQTSLDRFFSKAYSDNASPGVIAEQATNVSIGGDNTIDLVNLFLDLGAGRIGGGPSS